MDITVTDGTNSYTFTDIQDYEGFEYSDVRDIVEDVPGRDGALFIDSKFGRRLLTWTGEITGAKDTRLSDRRDLLKALKQGETITVKFTTYDSLSLQATGVVLRPVMPYTRTVHRYQAKVLCPDWRLFSQSETSSSTGTTDVEGGTALPTALPASLSADSSSNLVVSNDGNEDAPPTFEIAGPGTTFNVQNITTGESFQLDLTLTSGETVTVNVQNRTVTKGSNQNVYGNFDGDFWELEPGNNEIFFNGVSGTTDDTELTVTFRDAYRGI